MALGKVCNCTVCCLLCLSLSHSCPQSREYSSFCTVAYSELIYYVCIIYNAVLTRSRVPRMYAIYAHLYCQDAIQYS